MNVFDSVIKSIERKQFQSQSPILISALEDGRTIIDEVNSFLAARFGVGHAKRTLYYSSWARNRRKFIKLGEKLARNRRRVKEAILAEV